MSYQKFSSIGQLTYTPNVKLSDLEINKQYQIHKIDLINTKYGRKLYVNLKEKNGNIFLPDRFNRLSDQDKSELMKFNNSSALIYCGQSSIGGSGKKTSIIEFKPYECDIENTEIPSTESVPSSSGAKKRDYIFLSDDEDNSEGLQDDNAGGGVNESKLNKK